MLGREVNKPVDVIFGVNRADSTSSTSPEYVAHIEKVIKTSHDAAQENLGASILHNKQDYDLCACQVSYNVRNLVYVFDPSNKPGVLNCNLFLELHTLLLKCTLLCYKL